MLRWVRAAAPSSGTAWVGGLLGGALAVRLTVDSGRKARLEAIVLAVAAAAVSLLGPRRTP